MATIYSKIVFSSDILLLKKIYNFAGYKKSELPILMKAAQRGDLSMEFMLENAIGKVGKLKRSNKSGEDYHDGSDCKKVTVTFKNNLAKHHRQRIAKIETKNKKGTLRIAAVDTLSNEIFYFVVPAKIHLAYTKNSNKKVIRIPFAVNGGKPKSFRNDNVLGRKLWDCQVKSFKELCK